MVRRSEGNSGHRTARLLAAILLATSPNVAAVAAAATQVDRFRVTIIGIDGATWRVIDPLLARGELPNVAQLVQSGVRAPLRSRMPLYSAAVWTTIATGVTRERHGITNFENSSGRLSASLDRRHPTLWTLASAAGLRSAVIGWWVTYPAEAINGVIISERALKTREEDLVALLDRPPASAERARLAHPPSVITTVGDLLTNLPDQNAGEDERAAVVRRLRAEDVASARLLMRLRERLGTFDLEMLLLRGIDPVSHHFWKYFEPDAAAYEDADRPAPADVIRYRDTIEDHYRYVDSLLGELQGRGAQEHVVVLLSDHGFEAGSQPFRGGALSGTHQTKAALYGILVMSGGPIRAGVRLERATILDIAPTVLHLLGLPVAETSAERVLTEAFDPQWVATHAVRTVPTYPGPAVALPAQDSSTSTSSPADQRVREQLRALGYVE
jgi:predicted AlkP superfamily phosphohydrolase/phosphomutase